MRKAGNLLDNSDSIQQIRRAKEPAGSESGCPDPALLVQGVFDTADLVVVGTHGRRALARMLVGSVAELTVRLAPCPVLVVRPKARPAPLPAGRPG